MYSTVRVGAMTVALFPATVLADIFYGLADTTLAVSQAEPQGIIRTYQVPVAIAYRVESDFSTLSLLGIDFGVNATVYEDQSHNFAFAFHIAGTISGVGPLDIDIVPGTDNWVSEYYWDRFDAHIGLERRIFNNTSHFEAHNGDDALQRGFDTVNFNGYPGNITYARNLLVRPEGGPGSWSLGSIPYSDIGQLSFILLPPTAPVSLAPAICNHSACGDYNQNGQVDAADYVLWRKTLRQSGPGFAADGNSNNAVDLADYYVWQRRFGQATRAATTSVPEPSALLCALLFVTLTSVATRLTSHLSRRRDPLASTLAAA